MGDPPKLGCVQLTLTLHLDIPVLIGAIVSGTESKKTINSLENSLSVHSEIALSLNR